jgi:gamma-butyrobetaine dioxygenase
VTEGGVQVTKDGIAMTWTDGHKSFFEANFLERHAFPTKLAESHHDHCIMHEAWTNKSISECRDLFIPYETIHSAEGLVKAIIQLSKYGLLFVSGVSNKETSNNACELRVLAEIFGEIRPTFYGPLWDVINVRNSKNIGYTNLALGLHVDLLCVAPSRIKRLPTHRVYVDISNIHRDIKSSTVFATALLEEPQFL